MSIPKEPRQLMINLMYLVLMALLALNVSAEVMNAFFDIDKSLTKSNDLQTKAISETRKGIQPLLDKKPKLKEPLNEGLDKVTAITSEFIGYVEAIKDTLIDNGGNHNGGVDDGDYKQDKNGKATNKPKGMKNKDFTTRLMVKEDGPQYGNKLEAQISETRQKLIEVYTNTIKACATEAKLKDDEVASRIQSFTDNITLAVDSSWTKTDKASWAEYKFKQMPLAACIPTLTKLQADAKNAETSMVNDLAQLVGGREIKLNKFFPVMNAKKGYVIKGEKFEAEVAIGAFSDEFAKSAKISVNGQNIRLNGGKGTFTETANSIGKKKLRMNATVINPLSGEKMTGSSEFEYEVGLRSANVSATKMNVFYVGVDNPVALTASGVSSNQLKASCAGGGCTMSGSGPTRTVRVSQVGREAVITLSGGGLIASKFPFRVKRIPDPVPCFKPGGESSGSMPNGSFKARGGILADLRNFDFDARCNVAGFDLTKQAKRADPVTANNPGARYSGRAANLVNSAKPGDVYYFDNVRVKCPGDKATRKLPSMVWKIR